MPPGRSDHHILEALRFFLVSLAGLVIDIAIAWSLIALAGLPDSVSAIAGFSVATLANYLGHQLWTFGDAESEVSAGRFLAFAIVVLVSLGVRLIVLQMLGPLLPGTGLNAPLRLGLAATVSFFVTFLLSKFLVFGRRQASSEEPARERES